MSWSSNAMPVSDWLTKGILETPVTVGVTATALPATAASDRRHISIYNNSGSTIFLGSAAVTVARGFPLPNGGTFSISLDAAVVIYGICSAADKNVRVLEGW